MKKYLKNQDGFSLVELLVAMVLMVIIMGGVFNIFGSSLRINDQNKKNTLMEMQARKVLDNIINDVKFSTGFAWMETDKKLTVTTSDGGIVEYQWMDSKKIRRTVSGISKDITDNTITVTNFKASPSATDSSGAIIDLKVRTIDWNKNDVERTFSTAVHSLPVSK